MNLKLNEIYTVKLNSGEEIIGKLVQIEPALQIENPILAALGPQGLQLMPAMFSANLGKTATLNTAGWAMIAECREDVRNSWIQATTGIAPVTKQIITG